MKLYYFAFRGRGEQVRLLCHAVGATFEDVRVGRTDFGAMRDGGPGKVLFRSLPVLEDGDLTLPQGPAIMAYVGQKNGAAPTDPAQAGLAFAVTLGAEDMRSKYFGLFRDDKEEKQKVFAEGPWRERWLPAYEHLLQQSEGFMVGSQLSYADIAVWDAIDAIQRNVTGADFSGFDRVASFYDRIAALPSLAAYLSERGD